MNSHKTILLKGLRDGIPIGLGYLAVSFSLGVAARGVGLSAFQGFLASLLNNASAGEYAGFTVIGADAPYIEMVLMTLIANARYLLMSCALSQRFSSGTPFYHRLLIGYGLTISRPGSIDPFYTYGAMLIAIPCWAGGTALGVIAGNILPPRIVSALNVALFGMFIAIIIPPARRSRVVAGCVLLSFLASFAASRLPLFSQISSGTKTIILTVAISAAAAALFPVKDEEKEASHEA
jgi:predicted branched-subunit amino acid permease